MPDETPNNEQKPVIINGIPQYNPEPTPTFSAPFNNIIQDVNVNPYQQNTEPIVPAVPVVPVTPAEFTPMTAPTEPIAVGPVINPTDPVVAPVKPGFFKRKKLVIGLIIASFIVIAGGVSAFAMTSWYQNPERVLADSVIQAVTARASIYTGDFNYEGSGVKVKVSVTTKQANLVTGSVDVAISVDYSGKNYSINTSALYDNAGDLYIKLSNLKAIVAEAKKALNISDGSAIATAVDKLVTKIDGTWVKISNADLAKYSESASKSKSCMNDTLTKLKSDSAAVTQMADIYRKNAFVIIDKDLGLKDGNFSYEVKLSIPIAKSFVKGIKETETYKSMVACDKSFAIDENSIKDDAANTSSNPKDKATLTISADQWSHKMTKIEAKGNSGDSTFLATIVPSYNQTVTIETPADSMSLTQLQTYIEDIYKSLYSSYNY